MNIKKVPCLAYIIKSQFPENIGRVVEVHQRGENPLDTLHPHWVISVSADAPPMSIYMVFVNPFGHIVTRNVGRTSVCADDGLKPITGLDLDDADDSEIERPNADTIEQTVPESVVTDSHLGR